MRKFLVVLAVLLLAVPAWATPFLVSNPDTTTNQPTYYEVVVDGGSPVDSPAQTVTGGVRLHYDVASLNLMVTHTFAVKACKTNDAGVEVCSTAVNFTYPAPVAPVTPSGVKLER